MKQISPERDTTVWAKWSSGNCARNWNLTIRTNVIYANANISPEVWHMQTTLGFWHQNKSPNFSQTNRRYNNQQKKKRRKRTWRNVSFSVLADHRVKLKEKEKKDKYLDLILELKKQTNCGTWKWRLDQL